MSERRFRKGDVVEFDHGIYHVQGVVKEDRGPIGIGGRRLYLIEYRRGPKSESVHETELPAERPQLVNGAASTK
jgi:hypothetical protein